MYNDLANVVSYGSIASFDRKTITDDNMQATLSMVAMEYINQWLDETKGSPLAPNLPLIFHWSKTNFGYATKVLLRHKVLEKIEEHQLFYVEIAFTTKTQIVQTFGSGIKH